MDDMKCVGGAGQAHRSAWIKLQRGFFYRIFVPLSRALGLQSRPNWHFRGDDGPILQEGST